VLIPAIALGLPILDTLLAMSRRAVRGRPLFRADKEHIHHRLLAIGLSHKQAVLVLYGLCVVLGALALMLTYATSGEAAAILVVLGIFSFLFLRWLGYIQLEKFLPEQRRRSRALRAAVRPFADRLRRAVTVEDVWTNVRDVTAVFDAKCARLDLSTRSNGRSATPISFTMGFDEVAEAGETAKLFRARFVLVGVKPDDGAVEMAWDDGRKELDPDTEIAIELFCDYLAQACDRVRDSVAPPTPPHNGTGNGHHPVVS
jgi:UDP-GlcNAc:undecaprenyl-phosphate GlcNAc-1-phosphate transferase